MPILSLRDDPPVLRVMCVLDRPPSVPTVTTVASSDLVERVGGARRCIPGTLNCLWELTAPCSASGAVCASETRKIALDER
jgi:hypothetical protein